MSIKKGDFVVVQQNGLRDVCLVIEKGNLSNNYLVENLAKTSRWTSRVELVKRVNPIIAEENGSVDCIRKINNKFAKFVIIRFSDKDFFCYYSKNKINTSQSFTSKEDAIRWLNFQYAFLKAIENDRK
jgi:hypothetical protein